MLIVTLAAILLGIYTNYLQPLFDFRAYKVGADIPKSMQPTEPLRFSYTMTKNGEEKEFDKYPTDSTWIFKAMTVLNEEAKPKITDYAIWNAQGDFTKESFTGEKIYFIIQNIKKYNEAAIPDIKILADALIKKGKTVAILTSSGEDEFTIFANNNQLKIPFYFGDEKVLKTIGRVNPTLWIMKNGIVKGKWSGYAFPSVEEIEVALKK
jgi:hypothetical protein